MPTYNNVRRYYLRQRMTAKLQGEEVFADIWRSKQEAQPAGDPIADDFPYREQLVAAGYTGSEDLHGTDVAELRLAGLTTPEANTVMAALDTEAGLVSDADDQPLVSDDDELALTLD